MQNSTLFVTFTAAGNALYASGRGSYESMNPLANVTVLGVRDTVTNDTLNGMNVESERVVYNESSRALVVSGLEGMTSGGAWKGDWVLRWS